MGGPFFLVKQFQWGGVAGLEWAKEQFREQKLTAKWATLSKRLALSVLELVEGWLKAVCIFYDGKRYSRFFVSVFYGHTHGIWKLPGQGSNLSRSCNLCHSCGNTRSINPLHLHSDCADTVGFLTHSATVGTPTAHFYTNRRG